MSKTWILEVPLEQGENAEIPWTIVWPSAAAVGAASIAVAVYKLGTTTNVASTVMPTGTHTASGNSITMKPLKLLTGGEKYIISITTDIDGVVDETFGEVWALKSETGRL